MRLELGDDQQAQLQALRRRHRQQMVADSGGADGKAGVARPAAMAERPEADR